MKQNAPRLNHTAPHRTVKYRTKGSRVPVLPRPIATSRDQSRPIFIFIFAAADNQEERKLLLSHSFTTDAVKLKKKRKKSHVLEICPSWDALNHSFFFFFIHSFIHTLCECVCMCSSWLSNSDRRNSLVKNFQVWGNQQ